MEYSRNLSANEDLGLERTLHMIISTKYVAVNVRPFMVYLGFGYSHLSKSLIIDCQCWAIGNPSFEVADISNPMCIAMEFPLVHWSIGTCFAKIQHIAGNS